MQLLANPVLLANRLLYGIPNAPIVQLGNIVIVEALVFRVPWVHIVIKATLHAPHAKQIAFLAKDLLSVSPAHPD